MNQLGELDLEQAADEAAGNWQKFRCFVWFREDELDDADNWAIIYHSHRDSGLISQSNAAVMEAELKRFTEGDDPDLVFESHDHWAVGHVDGFSVRVFSNGEITDAFRAYHDLAERMDNYSVLDEVDYGKREFDATVENIADAAWRLKSDYDLPDDWECKVFRWLADHRCNAIENTDDQGGWPEEDDLEAAFSGLGYSKVA